MPPISQESAARSDNPVHTPIIDEGAYARQDDSDGDQPVMPSQVVEPQSVDEVPQQGATQPGSGSEVSYHEPGFKEKVIGYAKEVRGATFGNAETKAQGQRIVHGDEAFETKKVGPKAP